MASSRKLQLVFLIPSFLELLFLSSSALGATGTANGSDDAAAAPATARARSLASSSQFQSVFNLDRYGARGDGSHDDTHALAKAWKAACASPRPAVVLVPGGKRYLLKILTLRGPCKSSVTLTPCKEAPTALSFHYCTSLRVQDLKILNSQQIHMSIEDCTDVQLTGLSITASGTSPNTDGIHITRSKDVQVTNCKIKTGDDCMSIENGTHNLHVSQVVCGPGHGISIGSLGDDNSRAEVSGIFIDSVQLYGTTNGARIKTYQGGSGYAKDITFQNMIMDNVKNPIIIDQNYCDKAKPCKAQGSAVEVSNVVFKNIRGTTITKDAIKLNCSKNVPCHGITLQNIDLKMEGSNGAAESTCQNAKWKKSGMRAEADSVSDRETEKQAMAGWCFQKRAALAVVLFSFLLLLAAAEDLMLSSRLAAAASGDQHPSSSSTLKAARKLLLNSSRSIPTARMGPNDCSEEDVVVYQSSANPLPSGVPAYTVQIVNVCGGCTVSDVHVSCGDFASTELVDPGKFHRLAFNDCVVKAGGPLQPSETVSFQYSNSFSYQLNVASVSCE
ncbi:Polygalacturonase [Dichanthelium oligosanthes]|uniref:Polygalacturonase n=1 Tax=Dichanthelium oligosanthes TaxID=888268 RepID=A0A1E5W6M9_9POAL|nr:Polygalacturonase [Dichanthelium oligosanthes]